MLRLAGIEDTMCCGSGHETRPMTWSGWPAGGGIEVWINERFVVEGGDVWHA